MAHTAVLGFPRIGADRELMLVPELHRTGRLSTEEPRQAARSDVPVRA